MNSKSYFIFVYQVGVSIFLKPTNRIHKVYFQYDHFNTFKRQNQKRNYIKSVQMEYKLTAIKQNVQF